LYTSNLHTENEVLSINENEICRDIVIKIATNYFLNFADLFLVSSDLQGYDETTLVSHIQLCYFLAERTQNIHFAFSNGTSGVVVEEILLSSSNDHISLNKLIVDIPSQVTDAIVSACSKSAWSAVHQSVHAIIPLVKPLLDLFFLEKSKGWLGGSVIEGYIDRLTRWLKQINAEIPSTYALQLTYQTYHNMLKMYLQQLILVYTANKSLQLSLVGAQQFASDLLSMKKSFRDKCSKGRVEE
jgi:hypothetical protein